MATGSGFGDFFDYSENEEIQSTFASFPGSFVSKLDFKTNRLVVTVRLAWRFGHSFKRNKFSASFLWSADRQAQFKQSFRNLIWDYWDRRYPIVIRHAPTGDTRTVIPEFELVDVTDGGGDRDHKIWVSALPTGVSYVGGPRCKLHAYDADADPSHSVLRRLHAWGIQRLGVVKTMRKAIQDLAKGGVKFARDSVAWRDDREVKKLDDFAKSLHTEIPIFPGLQIKLESHRLPDERDDLDRRRVDAVMGYLVGKGFKWGDFVWKEDRTAPVVRRLSRVLGGATAAPCVTLQYRQSSTQQFLDRRYIYPIAAHEFGHMLGLPDEYAQSKKEQNAFQRALDEYNSLCDKFEVPRPPLNTDSMSLMAAGNQLLPSHYVTLAEAVSRHLMRFYSREALAIRLTSGGTAAAQTRQQILAAGENMLAQEPWVEYKITIGPMRKEANTRMVPLERYNPQEAGPAPQLSLPEDIGGRNSGSVGW